MLKSLTKTAFRLAGLNVEWRDRLAEQIPNNYERSPFLPRVYKQTLQRILYFEEMVNRVSAIDGDVVECGVSIGHGLLYLALLHDAIGKQRHYYGFDSFAGFPSPTTEDNGTHAFAGYYSSPPEIVRRVLRDGRVDDDAIKNRVHLVKGFFDETLPKAKMAIAMLHLDCDLYESYRCALTSLFPQVVSGGIVMFDEYEDPEFPGARQAIDEYFCSRPEQPQRHRFGKFFVVKE